MRCFQCGHTLTENDFCTFCGQDVRVYKRICNLSYIHYNEGLEKAQVRDLSGAVVSLNRSLKYNKRNIPARNLLGLVLYESGDWIHALVEWIISLNLRPEDNIASDFIKDLQQNTKELDTLNKSIKRYNQALSQVKKGDDDLAVIQLQQAVSDNPHFVKARALLGLLYMQHHEYDKARQTLLEAHRIDLGDATVSSYLNSLRKSSVTADPVSSKNDRTDLSEFADDVPSAPRGRSVTYRRGWYLFIGALAAFLVTWFLLTPARVSRIKQQSNEKVLEYTDQIQSLQAENESLRSMIPDTTEGYSTEPVVMTNATVADYQKLLKLQASYDSGSYDAMEVFDSLQSLSSVQFSSEGQQVYQNLMDNVKERALTETIYQGNLAYGQEDYEQAAEYFKKVTDADPTYNDGLAMFYLGLSYDYGGKKEEAKEIYYQLISMYPDSNFAVQSKYLLTLMGEDPEAAAGTISTGTQTYQTYESYEEDTEETEDGTGE